MTLPLTIAVLALVFSNGVPPPALESGRHPQAPVELEHWGQLAGEWRCRVRSPTGDGDSNDTTATWIWRYVLDGRAVQDDYVGEAPPGKEPFRGGGLRIFNSNSGEWEISWIDNRSAGIKHYIASSGPDFVTMRKAGGEDPHWRTRFLHISPHRFSWSNEPSGGTMECRRTATVAGSTTDRDPRRKSLEQSRDGYWSASGEEILFVSDRAGTYELYEMSSEGGPARRLTSSTLPFYYPSYSPDGSKIVMMSYEHENRAAVWTLNSDGTELRRLTDENAYNADPNWTSDGSQIVFHHRSAAADGIFVMNADGSDPRPIIEHEANEYTPVPSPDGTRIAVVSERGGPTDIWLFDIDGTNPRNLTSDPEWNGVPRWSADSASIVYYTKLSVLDEGRPGGRRVIGSDLFLIRVESGKKVRLTETEIQESGPILSPDGSKICFTAKGADGKQLWIMNADGTGRRRLTQGGSKEAAE